MKNKIRKHIKNELLIDKINENHGYPVYPISRDYFESLLKKIVNSDKKEYDEGGESDEY